MRAGERWFITPALPGLEYPPQQNQMVKIPLIYNGKQGSATRKKRPRVQIFFSGCAHRERGGPLCCASTRSTPSTTYHVKPQASPRMPRATRRGLRCSATAASKTSRTDPEGCSPGSRVLHRLAAEAVALRRRLPALSTEQARGGTVLHQSRKVRTSQRKHQMLPQHTPLCAAQRTGHATQSQPSVCPRGCLRKAWQARARHLRGHALRPGERATKSGGGAIANFFSRLCTSRAIAAENLRIHTMDSASLSAAVTAEIERQQAR